MFTAAPVHIGVVINALRKIIMPDIDPKIKEAALKPFKEKSDLAAGFIDEIREKLGEEESTKINDTLIGLQGTLVEAAQVHEATVEENINTKDRNAKLVEVNNDLYIKNSAALKKDVKPEPNANDMDDDEALDTFVGSVVENKK